MHYPPVFQLLLLAVLAHAQNEIEFTCFEGGTPAASCESFITTFCETFGNTTFTQNDTGSRCFNVAADEVQCNFISENITGASNPPSVVNCEAVLSAIVDVCPTGGFGNIVGGTFDFVVQPNTGTCPITV